MQQTGAKRIYHCWFASVEIHGIRELTSAKIVVARCRLSLHGWFVLLTDKDAAVFHKEHLVAPPRLFLRLLQPILYISAAMY